MKKYEIIAKTFFGLEEILSEELKDLGAENVIIHNRAVSFDGDDEILYKANCFLRTALRILKPIAKFRVSNPEKLYNKVKRIEWEKYFDVSETFAIDSVVSSKYFKHSKYAALRTKDAVADRFRSKYKKRPSVDIDNPTLRIHVHIYQDQCTVSLDSSGDSLHKRGYRTTKTEAPLNEVLAAGMIILSGWDKQSTFIDPMCGSGTIPIEAAMIALNIAPRLMRRSYGFQNWKDFDKNLWNQVQKNSVVKNKLDFEIIASDKSLVAVSSAKQNIANASLEKFITVKNEFIESIMPESENGIVIMNPPYGERLKENDILSLYKMIGDSLKNNFSGFDAWILSSSKAAMKNVGLKTSKRLTLYNGALECKFHNYSLYKGSKKNKGSA